MALGSSSNGVATSLLVGLIMVISEMNLQKANTLLSNPTNSKFHIMGRIHLAGHLAIMSGQGTWSTQNDLWIQNWPKVELNMIIGFVLEYLDIICIFLYVTIISRCTSTWRQRDQEVQLKRYEYYAFCVSEIVGDGDTFGKIYEFFWRET